MATPDLPEDAKLVALLLESMVGPSLIIFTPALLPLPVLSDGLDQAWPNYSAAA